MVLSLCGQCGDLKHKDEMLLVAHKINDSFWMDIKCVGCVTHYVGLYIRERDGDCSTCSTLITEDIEYVVCENNQGYWTVVCKKCYERRNDLRPAGMKYDLQDRDLWFNY